MSHYAIYLRIFLLDWSFIFLYCNINLNSFIRCYRGWVNPTWADLSDCVSSADSFKQDQKRCAVCSPVLSLLVKDTGQSQRKVRTLLLWYIHCRKPQHCLPLKVSAWSRKTLMMWITTSRASSKIQEIHHCQWIIIKTDFIWDIWRTWSAG